MFHPKHYANIFNPLAHHININGCNITPAMQVLNLGAIQDSHLTMEAQVNSICKTCYFHLRNISAIRKYITTDACRTLVQASIVSRLDYSNSLLYGLPQTLMSRLQRLQNSAARIITRTRRQEHISPILMELHWLPMDFRPKFKVLVFTYKALAGTAPKYLCDLVQRHQPTRTLRSSAKALVVVPKTRTATYGDRSFRVAAATLWNGLPADLKDAPSLLVFRKRLKTYLFQQAFPCNNNVAF